jgi:hypothetical protein
MKRAAIINVVGLTPSLLTATHMPRLHKWAIWQNSGHPRHRRQRLVQSRTCRSPVLETIQPPRHCPKNLGHPSLRKSEVHLRQTFLVV